MRIAIVTGEYPTISETFVLSHVKSLLASGHDVTVLAFKTSLSSTNNSATEPSLQNRILLLDPFAFYGSRTRFVRRLAFLASEGWRNPGTTLRSLDPRIGGPRALGLSLFGITHTLLSQDQFDIIHCHFGWIGVLGAKLKVVLKSRAKLIVTFHGSDICVPGALGTKRDVQLLLQACDAFTCNTNFIRNEARSLGIPLHKCSIWRMGVDMSAFHFRERALLPNEPVRILTVARLVEVKGIEYVIRALPLVRPEKSTRIEYHIVGDGDLRTHLEHLARPMPTWIRVIFHGNQSHDTVRQHLDRAHIFVLAGITASNNAREGQSVALIEAQAVGLPVLASNVGGMPEAILPERSGYLVPERDPLALAERLTYLINGSASWGQMGRAGRSFVEREFALDRCTTVIQSLYAQLVSCGIPLRSTLAAGMSDLKR